MAERIYSLCINNLTEIQISRRYIPNRKGSERVEDGEGVGGLGGVFIRYLANWACGFFSYVFLSLLSHSEDYDAQAILRKRYRAQFFFVLYLLYQLIYKKKNRSGFSFHQGISRRTREKQNPNTYTPLGSDTLLSHFSPSDENVVDYSIEKPNQSRAAELVNGVSSIASGSIDHLRSTSGTLPITSTPRTGVNRVYALFTGLI
ncbi:hypothetical protein F5X96DRAFT_524992 [Biscogniauxia mediterranea]|nr:hypothetical protein F5X96DRAFT_524992 [Biscogniauxia mediterranea]